MPTDYTFLTALFLSHSRNRPFFSQTDKYCTFDYPDYLELKHCTFEMDSTAGDLETMTGCLYPLFKPKGVWVDSCTIDLPIQLLHTDFSSERNHIIFEADSLKDITLFDVKNCNLYLHDSYLESGQLNVIQSSADIYFRNVTSPNPELYISTSESRTYYNISANPNTKKITIRSSTDTVRDISLFGGDQRFQLEMYNSELTGSIFLDNTDSIKANMTFSNCRFINSTIPIDRVDTLELLDCIIEKSLKLPGNALERGSRPLYLKLENIDLAKVSLDFTENTVLMLDSVEGETERTYEFLLNKFKNESKLLSYKYADIQYQKYKLHLVGWLGDAWSVLNNWWWNYGYERSSIIKHTFTFLLVFFIINWILGDKLLSFYPVLVYNKQSRWVNKGRYFGKKFFLAFVFTLLIFFSLSIDFKLLNANRTRMMIYFLFQYFVGLICLFFLFNAILKIG